MGHRLQQMQQVQPQDAQFVGVVVEFDGQPLPQVRPGGRVPVAQLGESARVGRASARPPTAGSDVATSRPVTTVTIFSTRHRLGLPPARRRCRDRSRTPRRRADTSPTRRLRRATRWSAPPWRSGICDCVVCDRQQHRVRRRAHRLSSRAEMVAGQLPVALDQQLRHVAVERRADLDRPRPVLGDDRRLQRGDVGQVHRDESVAASPRWCGRRRRGTATRGSAPRREDRESGGRTATSTASTSNQSPPSMRNVSGKPVGQVHQALVVDLGARRRRRRGGCTHRRHRCPGSAPDRPCDSGAAPRVAK